MRAWDACYCKALRPDVLVHGSYFTGNVGDRAIGLVIRRKLRSAGIKAVLVSRFFTTPSPCSILIIGGGGVIHNNYRSNLRLRTEPANRSCAALYFAVGAPGFDDLTGWDRSQLRVLNRAHRVSVRDEESRKILSPFVEGDIYVEADPAWLFGRDCYGESGGDVRSGAIRLIYNTLSSCMLSASSKWGKHPGREKVGVALAGKFDLRNLEAVKNELHRLSQDAELFFIPFSPKDLRFHRKHLTGVDMYCFPAAGPGDTYDRVCSMDRIVAMRYHSLIFAALAGKPVSVLAYARKVWTLAEELKVPRVDVRRYCASLQLERFCKAEKKAVVGHLKRATRALDHLVNEIRGLLASDVPVG